MNPPSVDDLFGRVQERCLWQFVSRAWDRNESIDGVLGQASALLTGDPLKLDTPQERLFYADATALVKDVRERFPDVGTLSPAEVRALFTKLKERVIDLAVTKSRNRELTQKLY